MKNSITKLVGMAMLAVSIAAFSVSCSDDNPTNTETTFVLNRSDLKGNIRANEHITLESGEYLLTGPLVVENGGRLTVNAGVRIVGTNFVAGEQVRYIAVAQGGQIFVNGTATNPVIMTAQTTQPGAWGGLVLCGRAPVNIGTAGTAEVSELTYGGGDVNDNSGTIRYLQILYSGYSYNTEKEFNGLSMFGVGKGTTIEYVQVHEGSDDGFEWFGGTVDTKYLVSTSNEDDQFDWTEGWNGTNENWYSKQGLGRGNRGVEADNNATNHLASPISNPTISNLTLIGLGDEGTEPQALKLRVGTKGTLNNVVLSNWRTGIDVEHDAGLGYVVDGTLKVTNVRFDNVTNKVSGRRTDGTAADVTAVFTENAAATGAGNGTGVPTWAQGWTVGL